MDNIEKLVRENDAMVKMSLSEIKPLLTSKKRVILQLAATAFEAFMEITARVPELPRENANIKSFERSINRNRKLQLSATRS